MWKKWILRNDINSAKCVYYKLHWRKIPLTKTEEGKQFIILIQGLWHWKWVYQQYMHEDLKFKLKISKYIMFYFYDEIYQ